MRLPHGDAAEIDHRKITHYLLSTTHPVGRHKYRVLRAAGFRADKPTLLTEAIATVAVSGKVSARLPGRFGVRYTVDGAVVTPSGASVVLRTIWMVAVMDRAPKFITAYIVT